MDYISDSGGEIDAWVMTEMSVSISIIRRQLFPLVGQVVFEESHAKVQAWTTHEV